jgi:hypothetical protein
VSLFILSLLSLLFPLSTGIIAFQTNHFSRLENAVHRSVQIPVDSLYQVQFISLTAKSNTGQDGKDGRGSGRVPHAWRWKAVLASVVCACRAALWF